jgi:hypothetical protein
MSESLRSLLNFVCAGVAVMLAVAAFNFVVDPLQIFRPARFYQPYYSNDTRMQDAGLIQSQRYDTAFMGTSLAVHFRQSDIDRALGVRSVKLAMSGSYSHAQSFVLASALERGAKRVIWEMDYWTFRASPEIDADIYLPADLYRRNIRGVAGYLFSGSMAWEGLLMVARSVPRLTYRIYGLTSFFPLKFPVSDADDINTLSAPDLGAIYNAERALADYAGAIEPSRRGELGGYDYQVMARNFDQDALALIKRYPNVEFDIYFTPYSILHWAVMRDVAPEVLKVIYDFCAHVNEELTRLPNVRLYDFRAMKDVTHDLNNYADVLHHSPIVDRKILEMLASRQNRVDHAAPTASLELLKAQVSEYHIER